VTTTAHVFVLLVMIPVVGFVLWLVRHHRLKSKYSMLWLTVAFALLVLAVFPGLLDRVSDAVGIDYPPATILFMAVAFLFLVVVHFSWELSRLEERSRVLAEETALLRVDLDRLRDELTVQVPTGTGDEPSAASASGAASASPGGPSSGASA
jgi:hypothetical protein